MYRSINAYFIKTNCQVREIFKIIFSLFKAISENNERIFCNSTIYGLQREHPPVWELKNEHGNFLAKRTAEEEKNRAQLKPSNGKLSRPISSVKRPFAVRSPGLRYRTNGTTNTKFQENFEEFCTEIVIFYYLILYAS